MVQLLALFLAFILGLFGMSPAPVSDVPTATPAAEVIGIEWQNYPKIDGSTSTLPVVQALYDAMFGKDEAASRHFPETASKTVPSYHKLIAGEVDLIVVPYPSQEVKDAASEAGVTLTYERFAAEALIFITPAENPVDSITAEQIRKIYVDYSIRNWSELSGPDKELVPISRNHDSGSWSQLDNFILKGDPIHPEIEKNYVSLTMEDIVFMVAGYHHGGMDGEPTNSYAIGFTLYKYLIDNDRITGVGEDLKILDYEGVKPDVETISSGYYPLSDGYYLVFRKDEPEDSPVRALVAWLKSDEGKAMLETLGFAPAD